jgi:hypothetical protein
MSEISGAPTNQTTLPIYIRFSGDCGHQQILSNYEEVNIKPNTWFYCKRCRNFRIIGDYGSGLSKSTDGPQTITT